VTDRLDIDLIDVVAAAAGAAPGAWLTIRDGESLAEAWALVSQPILTGAGLVAAAWVVEKAALPRAVAQGRRRR